jgi:hypothetical protein
MSFYHTFYLSGEFLNASTLSEHKKSSHSIRNDYFYTPGIGDDGLHHAAHALCRFISQFTNTKILFSSIIIFLKLLNSSLNNITQ